MAARTVHEVFGVVIFGRIFGLSAPCLYGSNHGRYGFPEMTTSVRIGPPVRPKSRHSLWPLKRALVFMLFLLAIAGVFAEHTVLLRAAADLWIVSDPVIP